MGTKQREYKLLCMRCKGEGNVLIETTISPTYVVTDMYFKCSECNYTEHQQRTMNIG